jgi:hypothetical protein
MCRGYQLPAISERRCLCMNAISPVSKANVSDEPTIYLIRVKNFIADGWKTAVLAF